MDGRGIIGKLKDAAKDVLRQTAAEVLDDLRAETSRAYPPASAPGEFPHKRSGELNGSFSFEIEEFVDAGPEFRINSSCPYFKYLERGTPKMAARPMISQLKRRWGAVYRDRMQERMRNIRNG